MAVDFWGKITRLQVSPTTIEAANLSYEEGAEIFCRIRSCLSTCRKQDVSATEALSLLFAGELPAFMLVDGVKSN